MTEAKKATALLAAGNKISEFVDDLFAALGDGWAEQPDLKAARKLLQKIEAEAKKVLAKTA